MSPRVAAASTGCSASDWRVEMGRPTSIERLAPDVRAQIENWLREAIAGRMTYDEVSANVLAQFEAVLGDEVPSRSALHRHARKVERLAERLRRSNHVAEQLIAHAGPDLADGKGFQVLVQGFNSLAFDLLANVEEGAPLDPENLMFFARAIQSVASADKANTDRLMKVRVEAKKEAAAAAEKVARSEGLSEATLSKIRTGILVIAQ